MPNYSKLIQELLGETRKMGSVRGNVGMFLMFSACLLIMRYPSILNGWVYKNLNRYLFEKLHKSDCAPPP
jgi:hypothetical protein